LQPRGKTSKLVLGCGSNVVDKFYPLRRWPKEGQKGFFLQENVCSARVVGGVTLNHLVWARALGTPTGLLALQGTDDNGVAVRQTLEDMGVDTSAIRVNENYTTSISHCFSSPGGERTILMAPGRLKTGEGSREGGGEGEPSWVPGVLVSSLLLFTCSLPYSYI
jgi:sugar/nucleoside kinase (ribokinase family)